MSVVRVYYAGNALWVDTVAAPLVAGVLAASLSPDGATVRITRIDGSYLFATPRWQDVADIDGNTFPTSAAAMAYLAAQLAMRRPVGDLYVIPVDIAQLGQTLIPLQQPPALLSTVRVEVNGTTYRPPDIAASAVSVMWLNPDFALAPSDRVSVVYS